MNLLEAARTLVEQPSSETAGLWPRAAAVLARQALEETLDELWASRGPGMAECSRKAQFLCLPLYVDPEVASAAYLTWTALSHAVHHHTFELGLTGAELGARLDTIAALRESARRTV